MENLLVRGNLDDVELRKLEEAVGVFRFTSTLDRMKAEKDLVNSIYLRFKSTDPDKDPVETVLGGWCPDFGRYVTGPFVPLYSGDSSHMRPSLVAPTLAILLEQASTYRRKKILGGKGTDTADIAVLSPYDALTWDLPVEDMVIAGANLSHREKGSDAPLVFTNLAKIAYYNLTEMAHAVTPGEKRHSGAYWGFQNHLYPAVDLVKIDPAETRIIEGHSTFFSPTQRAQTVDELIEWQLQDRDWSDQYVKEYNELTDRAEADELSEVNRKHPARASMEAIYDALCGVRTIDLGNQNTIYQDVEEILDPSYGAMVLAAHSLGNVSNPIRAAVVEAVKRGKLVIVASRCLIGEVNERYAGSLLDANGEELENTSQRIVSAGKFNRTTARAIAVRAILEGFGPHKTLTAFKTQRLMNQYSDSTYTGYLR